MKLLIMRHGETFWNTEGRLQGQIDIPLNENGIKMAVSCAEGMKDVPIDLCISSSLLRARQTAELCMAENRGYGERAEKLIKKIYPYGGAGNPHLSVVTAPSDEVIGTCDAEYGTFSEENAAFTEKRNRFSYLTDDRLKEAGFGPWEGLVCRGEGYSVPLANFGTYWSDPESPLIDPGVERLPHVAERVEEVFRELFSCEELSDKTVLLVVHGCVIRSVLYLMSGKTKFSGKVPLNCEVILARPDPERFLIEEGRAIYYDRSMMHDYYATMVQE